MTTSFAHAGDEVDVVVRVRNEQGRIDREPLYRGLAAVSDEALSISLQTRDTHSTRKAAIIAALRALANELEGA